MKAKDLIQANYQQILFVFIAFLAMVLVSYFYVGNIVQNQMRIIGDASMDTTQASVSAGLRETELLFANVVQGVDSMIVAQKSNADILTYLEKINKYFNAERSPLPDFMKVYGYIRNEFLDGSGWTPPVDYAPESRPWHIGAAGNNGKIFFSEPYRDAETRGICISFSQTILDQNGVSRGILALDLQLSRIAAYVHAQKLSGNGYGVLVDDKLQFIAHRDEGLIGKKMAAAGGDYTILARRLAAGESISAVRFQDADGADSIVFFRTVFNGWHIGVIIPRASYYEKVHTLGFVLGIMGFVLMAALSFLLVRTRVAKMRSEEESLSKSTFLARMSHEMRTPMNAVIGMTDIAKATSDPERKEYCLTRISEASTHLLGVINDVLDMSKIEAGKLELSETDFSIAAFLRQVETVVSFKIEEKKQQFCIQVAEDVPKALFADRQRLAQVVANLLSNANKFTPVGGDITLRVIRHSSEKKGCALLFEVEDTGIGVSPEQHDKIFSSFEQADGGISRKFGGTGLGLAISRKIIALMGGEIWIESELGKGARFIFTVLVEEGKVADVAEREESKSWNFDELGPIFSGKKLLLAEDVAINREILTSLLEGSGIHIDYAENGLEACAMFAAAPDKYSMIFMDIHMPKMNGLEAAKTIRGMELPQAEKIPIVAMTANVFKEDIEECRAYGMNGHVGKPLEMNEVLTTMATYMRDPLLP